MLKVSLLLATKWYVLSGLVRLEALFILRMTNLVLNQNIFDLKNFRT